MNRPWLPWMAYALAATVVLGTMLWLSMTVIGLDRLEAVGRRSAAVEGAVRLALWRLDAEVAPLVARINALPDAWFNEPEFAAKSAQRSAMWLNIPLIFGHVGGSVPAEAWRCVPGQSAIAVAMLPSSEAIARAWRGRKPQPAIVVDNQQQEMRQSVQQLMAQSSFDSSANIVQSNRRNSSYSNLSALMNESQSQQRSDLQASWIGNDLVLLRPDSAGSGSWHVAIPEWPALEQRLLRLVHDDLPDARLQSLRSEPGDPGHRMALLPIELMPGERLAPMLEPLSRSSLAWTLVPAWILVLVALTGGAMLLLAALRLSERRGAFVSAVTHELRTPLTTFRLYADLLEQDMVPAGSERTKLLSTLRIEAERLSHLVENVLSYARLERVNPAPARPIEFAALFAQVRTHVADRVRQAGLELVEEFPPDAAAIRVLADPAAVERILVNLVDNAGKYAANATDTRLHLTVTIRADVVEVRIRDHGPGVSPTVAGRLFTPFAKSSAESAQSAPGVGLGLALSRRLARQLGGDLRWDADAQDGATFVLTLQRVV
ncbi:MAG: HAMP domain-containing sensor histidine kinase [Planctomycetota bacterium]